MAHRMSLGQYLVGAVFCLGTFGLTAATALLIVARRLPGLPWPARGLAFALLWMAAVIAAELLPAAATVLTRGTVLAVAALELLAASFVRAVPVAAPSPGPRSGWEGSWDVWLSRALAAVGVGLVVVFVIAYVVKRGGVAVDAPDYLNFQMPNLGRWIQSGSLWMNNQFDPLVQTSTYPNNGDLLQLAALLPWHDDALVRFINLPIYALLGVVVYALGRELGAKRPASLLMAALVLSIQDVTYPALADVKPDTFMLASFGAGLVFLVRHHRTGFRADLLLGGLGLGLAFGSRWYGMSSVVVALAVWVLAGLLARRRAPRAVLGDGARLAAMIVLAGGFWLIRNWVVTGNPIYPVRLSLLGFRSPFDPAAHDWDFTVWHYVLRPHVFFHELLPLYTDGGVGTTGWLLAGGGVLAAVVAAVSMRRARTPGTRANAVVAFALLVCALGILAAYVITPGGAQGPPGIPGLLDINARWAMGAAIPAAAAVAWAALRLGAWRLPVEAGGVFGIWAGLHLEFGALPGLPLAPVAIAGLLAGAGAGLAALGLRRIPRAPRRLALGATVMAAVAGALLGGRSVERHVDATRYAGRDPVLRWLGTAAPSGHRIAIAGLSMALPVNWAAFGPRLGNEVAFLGPMDDYMLREYPRERPFVAALARGRYDVVVLGRGWNPTAIFKRSSPLSPTSAAEQARWLIAAGFRLVGSDYEYAVFSRARGITARGTRPLDVRQLFATSGPFASVVRDPRRG